MGLNEFLGGYKPTENEDTQGFDILKGTYDCAVTKLVLEDSEKYGLRYQMELTVNEVLEGNGAQGRKFWIRYNQDEKGIKRMLDDLFTAAVEIPYQTLDLLNDNLGLALDKVVKVRAWGWTPDKNRDGTPIEEGDRQTFQQVKVVNPAKAKKKVGAATPF